jgi:threonine dehydrogenase-like Zn-dependent dehydrogenase
MAAPAGSCVVLPDAVDLVAATLVEPLSCAVRGYDVLASRLGATVLVYGAGTMGLMMLELAKRTGAVRVDVVDTNAGKLERAAGLGCSGAAPAAEELDGGEGWDVVVDATGSAAAIQDGLSRVARGGTFLQFGVSSPDARVELSPYDVYRREITVTGSMAVLHSFERAVDLFAAGVLDPEVFITRQAPLAEYRAALDAFAAGEGLKTQVLP